MKKLALIIVSTFTFCLLGCGSSGSGAEPTTAQPNTAETHMADAPTGNNGSPSANPGAIPGPIVGEVLSLDVSDRNAISGFKIFAGGTVDPRASAAVQDLYAGSYMNIDFPCGFDSLIEYFPTPRLIALDDPAFTGTFGAEIYGGSRYEMVLSDSSVESGENSRGQGFDGRYLDNSSFIVGTSTIYDLVVDRIVQYEICD